MLKQQKFVRKNINMLLFMDDAILDPFLIVEQFVDDFSCIKSSLYTNSKADTDCLPLSCTVMIKPRAKVSQQSLASLCNSKRTPKCNNS